MKKKGKRGDNESKGRGEEARRREKGCEEGTMTGQKREE